MNSEFDRLTSDLMQGRISRRAFVRRVVGLTGSLAFASMLLAACGSSGGSESTVPSGGGTTATTGSSGGQTATATSGTGSGAQTATATSGAGSGGEAKSGGTLTHGSAQEPDRFWTPITGLTVADEIAVLVNESLFVTDEHLQYVPTLATEVPTLDNGGIAPDGLTYTIKLRSGVKWHDGTPFTSKDVKFTYDVVMMDGVDVRGRTGWDQITSVETPDETTVIYKFKEVYAPFMDRLAACQILPQHVLGDLDGPAINEHEWFRAPMGLGPFKFKEWVAGSHIALTKNPDYFKEGQPHLDSLVYKIIPDANTLINQLQTGDIDTRVRLSNADVAIVNDFPNVDVVTTPSVTPWVIWINNTRPPFDDKKVRQALAYGFDKEGVCNKLLKGIVEPAWGLISPLSWAYNPDTPTFKYDPEKAKALLDEAGWTVGSDGVREKDGKKFAFDIMNIAGEQERVQILSTAQAQWKEIGVAANIRAVDVATMWGNALPKRDYEMAYSYSGQLADPNMGSHYLSPKYNPSTNYAGYANEEVDDLLMKASQTVDREERKKLYFKAQEIVADDCVYLFVYWLANHTAINTRVQGYKPAPAYYEFWNAGEWSVKS